jgi:hypothetical protein
MNRIIRQAFGSSRPKDVFLNLLTFDRMVTRPVVHIVYWIGLGLLVIAAMAIAGTAVGEAIKEGLQGWLLATAFLIAGWLMILVGVLLWRSLCEFYLAVMSIAEDLRYLRQFQEKLPAGGTPAAPAPAPQAFASQTFEAAVPASPVVTQPVTDSDDITETPFFQPRFGKRPD